MSSLAKRTATTLIGVPAIFSYIYFLPYLHRFATMLLILGASLIGSYEIAHLLEKGTGCKLALPFWVPSLLVIATWVESFFPQWPITHFSLILLALVGFGIEIFNGIGDNFKGSLSRILGWSFLLVYPNYLFTFLVRISQFEHSVILLILYFSFVCANDIFAFIFGMWLGGSNKGILKVSPNKSVAGFVGGHAMSIIWCVATCLVAARWIPVWKVVLMGAVCSTTANIGDLIESVIKRSVGVKDSGNVIPGRGGILDSIDSLLATAPVFWLLCELLSLA